MHTLGQIRPCTLSKILAMQCVSAPAQPRHLLYQQLCREADLLRISNLIKSNI